MEIRVWMEDCIERMTEEMNRTIIKKNNTKSKKKKRKQKNIRKKTHRDTKTNFGQEVVQMHARLT